MNRKISITVPVENSVHERGFKAEHGLAWHIQFGSHPVLFDTGQTDLLIQNARQLGVSLDQRGGHRFIVGKFSRTLRRARRGPPVCV